MQPLYSAVWDDDVYPCYYSYPGSDPRLEDCDLRPWTKLVNIDLFQESSERVSRERTREALKKKVEEKETPQGVNEVLTFEKDRKVSLVKVGWLYALHRKELCSWLKPTP